MAEKRPPFVRNVAAAHPRQRVEVWFQDESRFGQQGTLTRVWARRGSRPTRVKQTEYDWIYLYGAANPQTGESCAWLAPTVNTKLMNYYLRMLSRDLGRRHAVLVLDGAGWHVAKDLQVPKNITLLPLPPYSPELNPMERLWAWLKSHQLSNRVYRGYDDLLAVGTRAWNSLTRRRIRSVCHTSWIKRRN